MRWWPSAILYLTHIYNFSPPAARIIIIIIRTGRTAACGVNEVLKCRQRLVVIAAAVMVTFRKGVLIHNSVCNFD